MKYCRRPFPNIYEQEKVLLGNHNSVVDKLRISLDDTINCDILDSLKGRYKESGWSVSINKETSSLILK